MPRVVTENSCTLSPEQVWQELVDCESFPGYMDVIRKVAILSSSGNSRVIAWSVLLKGSVLEWTETDELDHENFTIRFEQQDGDLERFEGIWQVRPSPEGSSVLLDLEFSIGIPLLADMLNPVAAKALVDHSTSMIRQMDERLSPRVV